MPIAEIFDMAADMPTSDQELLKDLLRTQLRTRLSLSAPQGVIVGELLALDERTREPVVCFADDGESCALVARSAVELGAFHIGHQVLLVFERGDRRLPIVIGVLSRGGEQQREAVLLDVDGRRLIVDAREQLVLRCGTASITLTATGKVIIEGSYVVSRSSGVNRIKGGSVQLN